MAMLTAAFLLFGRQEEPAALRNSGALARRQI